MEGRLTRKYGLGSPERARTRPELKPAKQQRSEPPQVLQPGAKVPVVYYLCRDRHLDHPHFVEVPVSSQEGLFLRDVVGRLNVLRGKRMASSYSWSCKRSYKNGFVWHDLSEDDLIVPVNGNEYILKGTELFNSSTSDGCHYPNVTVDTPKLSSPRQEPSNGHESPSDSSRIVIGGSNQSPVMVVAPSVQEDELSPSMCRTSSSSGNVSNSSMGSDGSPRLTGYKVYKPGKAANASTQTEERSAAGRRTWGNAAVVNYQLAEDNHDQGPRSKESPAVCTYEISPPPTSSSTPSSNGKVDTLESLIRAEARKMNSFRILEEDDVLISPGSKLKATNVLMQLITCGSLSVKDHHSFGLIHTYKPRFSHVNYPSPVMGSPVMLGEQDFIPENPKTSGPRLDEKCLNVSSLETKKHGKDEGKVVPILGHSSYVEADRSCKLPDPLAADKVRMVNLSRSKGLQRTMKQTSGRQAKSGAIMSPNLDNPRSSFSANHDSSFTRTSMSIPNGSSMPSTHTSSRKGSSCRFESFRENKDVVKIEERLPSGARIIIQSRCPPNDREACLSQ